MKLTNEKLKKDFENIIKITSTHFSPKPKSDSKKQTLVKSEDNLDSSNENFSTGILWLKQNVLPNISKHPKKEVNYFSSTILLAYIFKKIYTRIKSRVGTINDSLGIYLKSEDIDFGLAELSRKLENSFGKHTIYFISNLLSLQDIDSINIGKVLIKRIDEKIIKELPLYIENPDFLNVSLIKQEYFNPIRFIQEFKGKTLFEVTIDGYQVENEKSDVFDKALKEFKYVLSYFSICNTFLRNVGVDKYSIGTEKIKLNNTYGLKNNYQIYYLKNNKKANVLKVLNILSEYIALPDFRFIIDKALFEKIKKSCSLKNFNLIFQNDKFGEIGNKIKRSLDWVYKEMLEKDETDKAIALFISLETLITYGKDPLIGLTDEYAENIAIMTSNTVGKRYKEKKFFKNKIYSLRCKIMHNGIEVKREQDWNEIHRLKIYVAWTLHWFIRNIYTLTKDGNCTEEMKKYFEREKLK